MAKSKLRLRAVDIEAFNVIDGQMAELASAWPAPLPPENPGLSADDVDSAIGRVGIAAHRFQ